MWLLSDVLLKYFSGSGKLDSLRSILKPNAWSNFEIWTMKSQISIKTKQSNHTHISWRKPNKIGKNWNLDSLNNVQCTYNEITHTGL